MKRAFFTTAVFFALGLPLSAAGTNGPQAPERRAAVASTPYFALYSDYDSNLHDALLEAATNRNFGRKGLFEAGDELPCFGELPGSVRMGWEDGVAFYAEIVAKSGWDRRPQYQIRLVLSGVAEPTTPRDRQLMALVRGYLAVASPAYTACRWQAQDAENRQWVANLVLLLEAREEEIAAKLESLYETPFGGLPIRVDVVETVNWSGATTILLDPAGGHIQISNEYRGLEALEVVFHEASHTLMGRGAPIKNALAKAAKEAEVQLPGDLWHAVLFYTTGDTVRRVLKVAGTTYTPIMFVEGILEKHHAAVKSAWTAYLDGDRTLEDASADLARTSAGGGSDRGDGS